MVDLGTYVFKYLNTVEIKPEELFTNAYLEEVYESVYVCTASKRLSLILGAKFEKADLHKVMETQCQYFTMTQLNEFLKLLHKFEEFFDGTLGTWKTYPVDL